MFKKTKQSHKTDPILVLEGGPMMMVRKTVWIIVTVMLVAVTSVVFYRLGSFFRFRELKERETIPGNMVAVNDAGENGQQELPDQTKVDPVKPVDQPKADLKVVVEPVNVEGISDEAWAESVVILRNNGTIGGIFLPVPAKSTVVFHLPNELEAYSALLEPIRIKKGGKEAETLSWGMNIHNSSYQGGNGTNSLVVVALGADQQFAPKKVQESISLFVPDPRNQRFSYPGLSESGFGNVDIMFMTNQGFVGLADKKLLVRLYLEWIARNPIRKEVEKPINLLDWWNEINAR